MNKKQREQVGDLLNKAMERFDDVQLDCQGKQEHGRIVVWMQAMWGLCSAARDIVNHPRPPKMTQRQVILMADAFAYLLDAKAHIPGSDVVKDYDLSAFLIRAWTVHLPFLDKFRGIGHPSDVVKRGLRIE